MYEERGFILNSPLGLSYVSFTYSGKRLSSISNGSKIFGSQYVFFHLSYILKHSRENRLREKTNPLTPGFSASLNEYQSCFNSLSRF